MPDREAGAGQLPTQGLTGLRRHIGLVVTTLAGIVILAPGLFERGYFLRYDMVFVPHLELSASTAGLDGDVPRAVPNDLVVALFSTVLPGWIVQRVILLGAFCVIGAGVDRLRASTAMRAVAAFCLTWNPWIAERLSIGHWGYLWGYAAGIWAFAGAWSWRGDPSSWREDPRQDGASAEASFSAPNTVLIALVMGALSGSTGDVLVALILLIMLVIPGSRMLRRRAALAGVGLWLALGAAWWFPFLTLANSAAADGQGVTAFAAHSDGWGPPFLSLLAGGGIWHSPSWFPERANPLVAILSAALPVAGMVFLFKQSGRHQRLCVILLGATGLVLSGAASLSSPALVWVVQNVPGGGLLRDGQKFVCMWLIPAAFGLGALADALRRRFTETVLAPVSVAALALAPIALLPGLAFERGGQWKPANYPKEFLQVAHQLHDVDGGVAVFPWQLYRRYPWNDNAVVLDPWQRLLPGHVVVDDDLPLRSGIVRGESTDSARISAALKTGADPEVVKALKASGVRYVISQSGQPVGMGTAPQTGLVIHSGPELVVRDLGAIRSPSTPAWAPLGLICTLAGLTGVGAFVAARRWRK